MGQVDLEGDGTDDLGVIDTTAGAMQVAHRYSWGPDPVVQGSDETGGGIQSTYHNFTCSKCHTPHMGTLPRLLITNCLDNDTGWANQGTNLPGPYYGGQANGYYGAYVGAEYRGVTCHSTGVMRSGTHVQGTSDNGGWNNVTPW